MPSLALFLAVMIAAQASLMVAYNAGAVLAPVVAPALGVSAAALGPYVSVLGLASLAGGVLIDGLMRRHGGARTLQISTLGNIAGLLLAATGQPLLVMFSSLVLGFAAGMIAPAAMHLVSRVARPERAGLILGINMCGIPAGFGLSGVIYPLLLKVMNWQMSLVVVAATLVLLLPLLQSMRSAVDSDRDRKALLAGRALSEPLLLVWRTPRLRLLGWVAFSFVAAQMAFLAYMVSYVDIELGFTHVEAGSALLISQLTCVVARVFFGAVVDRVRRHFLLLGFMGIANGLSALALSLAQPGWSYAAIIMVSVAAGAFCMGWNVVYFTAVVREAPQGRAGTGLGGTQMFTGASTVIGPSLVAGILAAGGSYGMGFMLVALLSFVMSARLLLLERKQSAAVSN